MIGPERLNPALQHFKVWAVDDEGEETELYVTGVIEHPGPAFYPEYLFDVESLARALSFEGTVKWDNIRGQVEAELDEPGGDE